MRQLLDKEKSIIKDLVSARSTNHYEYMQLAYILRSNVQYDYLKWEMSEEKSYIETFLKDGTDDEKSEVFYKIIDLIGFFEELEKRGFVKFVFPQKRLNTYPCYHYDKNKYILDEISGVICVQSETVRTPITSEGDHLYRYYGEVVPIIEKYLKSIVLPLQSLVDYSKDYKL